MFEGCTSLAEAPVLPATTLAQYCYQKMFYGCSSLNKVRCHVPSTISAEDIPTYTGTGAYAWLEGVAQTGTFYTNADANWPSGASGIPTSWTRVNEGAPAVDNITKPLTFKATQDGSTVKLRKNGSPTGAFQTSTDGGNTWADYTLNTSITLNTGDEVSFRTSADRTSAHTSQNYFYFEMTGKIEAWHNVMSLYRKDDFATYESVVEYAFYRMFDGCTSLTKAPVLPATTLANSCYSNMFKGCTSLTEAPELNATTLANNCYNYMFLNCASLTKAPALPATTLSTVCYSNMFNGCTSLAEAPALPATTLANSCYSNMFKGCTSLTEAPALPATTLADYCYQEMFQGCTSLTKAHEFTATTLANYCYYGMFNGCTSLIKAPTLPSTTLKQDCYSNMFEGCSSLSEMRCKIPSSYSSSDISYYANNWLSGVSSTGTFYTNADANWTSGASGIPEGWTRVPAVDDPNKPLMLRAIKDNSSVTLTKIGTVSDIYQTSTNGTDWTNYTLGTKISLNGGESVYFRRRARAKQSSSSYVQFVMEGEIEAWHNAYSMIDPSFTKTESGVGVYGMYALFKGCSPLTKAPLLVNPVEDYCYGHMFEGCTSLTKAPELPYTALRGYCYTSMFEGCTSLTKAPELPATTLADYCYFRMFMGCTSLTQAPSIPVTNLADYCYCYMFSGCTSLTQAPELPATTLASYCYLNMFSGCTSLKEVRISATKSDATDPLKEWLSGVSATGDFYCDPNAKIFPTDSASGIPKNWTRRALADYPVTP